MKRQMNKQQRATEILKRLKKEYSKPGPFANWKNPLELVVVTMLSAQCTDAKVNEVSPKLFAKYRTARDFARAKLSDLEKIIYSTGFYKAKAQYLKGIGKLLHEEYQGAVPDQYEDLIRLPGLSKKSVCIVLAKAFNIFEGVAVDTHVLRIAPRLGLTNSDTSSNRDKIAEDLEKLYPPKEYLHINEYLITHGRAVCTPGIPKCGECILKDICPRQGVLENSLARRRTLT